MSQNSKGNLLYNIKPTTFFLQKISAKPTGDYICKNESKCIGRMNIVIDEEDKIYFLERTKRFPDPAAFKLWICINPLTNEWNHFVFSLSLGFCAHYYGTNAHVRRQKLYLVCIDTDRPRKVLVTVGLNDLCVRDVKEIPKSDNKNYEGCYDFVEEKMFFFNFDGETMSAMCVYDIDKNVWTETDLSHVRFAEREIGYFHEFSVHFFVRDDTFLIREMSGKIEIYDLKSGRLLDASKSFCVLSFNARKDNLLYFLCEDRNMDVFDCVRFEWTELFYRGNHAYDFANGWYTSIVLCSQKSSNLFYVKCKNVDCPTWPDIDLQVYKEIKDVCFVIASTGPLTLKELATLKLTKKNIREVRKKYSFLL
jgi:hypothetical protein